MPFLLGEGRDEISRRPVILTGVRSPNARTDAKQVGRDSSRLPALVPFEGRVEFGESNHAFDRATSRPNALR